MRRLPWRWLWILVALAPHARGVAHADRDVVRKETLVTTQKIPADLAPAIPDGGIYFASSSSHSDSIVADWFVLARLDASGLHQLLRHEDIGGIAYGWVDATTLVTVDGTASAKAKDAFTVVSVLVMDGNTAPKTQRFDILYSDWKLARGEALTHAYAGESLIITKQGEAWISGCALEVASKCKRLKYLRVHGGPKITSTNKPKAVAGRVPVIADVPLSALPKLPAPAGHSVKIGTFDRVAGFECKSPTSSHRSPRDDDPERDSAYVWNPRRVQWVLAKPAIFAVAGKLLNPVSEWESYVEYHRACAKEAMKGLLLFRPRIWGELASVSHQGSHIFHDEWKVMIDDTHVGTFAGGQWDVVVAPSK